MIPLLISGRKIVILMGITLCGAFISLGCEKNTANTEPKMTKSVSKTVALTFDDGPDSIYTSMILDVLLQKDVKATFFTLGFKILKYPDVVKRAHNEGHLIANHSYDHFYLPRTPFNRVIKNIDHAERIIDSVCGYSSKLFRPPWGAVEKAEIDSLNSHGYYVVLWDIDIHKNNSNKNNNQIYDVNSVVSAIVDNISPDKIVLLHDSNFGNKDDRMVIVEALPIIIDKLKNMGYTFVTVDKLIKNYHN